MDKAESDVAFTQRALANLKRDNLPKWLDRAIDLLSGEAAAFPPNEEQIRNLIDHIYPH